jgi:hypothetical protein
MFERKCYIFILGKAYFAARLPSDKWNVKNSAKNITQHKRNFATYSQMMEFLKQTLMTFILHYLYPR